MYVSPESNAFMLSVEINNVGEYDGDMIYSYTLHSDELKVKILNYGATISSILAPDREGNHEEILCGFNLWSQYKSRSYLANKPYFGSTIGRYCNRIAGGTLPIEGELYRLSCNNGEAHLHGGLKGFDRRVWNSEAYQSEGLVGVVMNYRSAHLEENYPGNLDVELRFELTMQGELHIKYHATTDRTTVVNLTNHAYFNLSGFKDTVLNHEVSVNSKLYTPTDEHACCTGEIRSVEGTHLDLRQAKIIASVLDTSPMGYDDNFVLDKAIGSMGLAARAYDADSGRRLEMRTTEPGMQLYTGYFIPQGLKGHGGQVYGPFSGFCFEAQHFPNSPHLHHFPSTLLRPGEDYRQHTIYALSRD